MHHFDKMFSDVACLEVEILLLLDALGDNYKTKVILIFQYTVHCIYRATLCHAEINKQKY
jgi:hypothetical protein